MLISDGWLGLSATECSLAMIGLGYRQRLASAMVGSFGLSASSDDEDGVGVLFGVQTLGS